MSLQKNVDLNKKSVPGSELLLYWKIPAFVRWLTLSGNRRLFCDLSSEFVSFLTVHKLKALFSSFEITERSNDK